MRQHRRGGFAGKWGREGAMAVVLVIIVVGYSSFQIPPPSPRQLILVDNQRYAGYKWG